MPLGTARLYEVYVPQFTQSTKGPEIASLNIDYVTAMDVYYAGTFDYIALGTNASGVIVAKYFYQISSFVVAWERGDLGGNITVVTVTEKYTAAAVYSNNSTKIYMFYTENGSLITVINQTETVQGHGCVLPPTQTNSTPSHTATYRCCIPSPLSTTSSTRHLLLDGTCRGKYPPRESACGKLSVDPLCYE